MSEANDAGATIRLTIDGKVCECAPGELLYDVARRNGIFIPTLCRNDAFDEHRACCRVCIVEVEVKGRSKVVTSCIYPVTGECNVSTNSTRVKENRAVIVGLLAGGAPASEKMTEMARFYGAPQFEDSGSLDTEKCVLCGLCVQACTSLGTGAISTVFRGVEKRVATPFGETSEDCVGCLGCANICPTGAIEYSESAAMRTVWGREFELVFCERCGAVLGTRESLALAARKADKEVSTLCDACRKHTNAMRIAQENSLL